MKFSHPISSYTQFRSSRDLAVKGRNSYTHQITVRVIKSTEAQKIQVQLDFDEIPDKNALLFVSCGKADFSVPIEKSIRWTPPEEYTSMVKSITISLSTEKEANFSWQIVSMEPKPYSY